MRGSCGGGKCSKGPPSLPSLPIIRTPPTSHATRCHLLSYMPHGGIFLSLSLSFSLCRFRPPEAAVLDPAGGLNKELPSNSGPALLALAFSDAPLASRLSR
jgi:hypothetical protein